MGKVNLTKVLITFEEVWLWQEVGDTYFSRHAGGGPQLGSC